MILSVEESVPAVPPAVPPAGTRRRFVTRDKCLTLFAFLSIGILAIVLIWAGIKKENSNTACHSNCVNQRDACYNTTRSKYLTDCGTWCEQCYMDCNVANTLF